EDDSRDLVYSGSWAQERGNFSGGSIRWCTSAGAAVTYFYRAPQNHRLYLGTRKAFNGSQITIAVDNQPERTEDLLIAAEDSLVRLPLGEMAGGVQHSVTVTHSGIAGRLFYFDFFEIAVPAADLPTLAPDPKLTLA